MNANFGCANVVASGWDEQNNHLIAASTLDQVVSTPSEFDAGWAGATGQHMGEGTDSGGDFRIAGYLVSDDGNANGSNLRMRIAKHYDASSNDWADKVMLTDITPGLSSVGSTPIIEWTVPSLVFDLTGDDWGKHAFIFEDMDSLEDVTVAVVRRGERLIQGETETDIVFNAAAREQILAEFVIASPAP